MMKGGLFGAEFCAGNNRILEAPVKNFFTKDLKKNIAHINDRSIGKIANVD